MRGGGATEKIEVNSIDTPCLQELKASSAAPQVSYSRRKKLWREGYFFGFSGFSRILTREEATCFSDQFAYLANKRFTSKRRL